MRTQGVETGRGDGHIRGGGAQQRWALTAETGAGGGDGGVFDAGCGHFLRDGLLPIPEGITFSSVLLKHRVLDLKAVPNSREP